MLRSFILRGAGSTGVGTICRAVNTDSTRFVSTFARLAIASSHSMLSLAMFPPLGRLFELIQSSLHVCTNRRNDPAELGLGICCLLVLLLLQSATTTCASNVCDQGCSVCIPFKNWFLYDSIRADVYPTHR